MKYFHSIQKTIKAILRYFGFSSSSPKTTAKATNHDPPSAAGAETGSNVIEEIVMTREIRSRRALRRPPRPPVDSGRRGQIHSTY